MRIILLEPGQPPRTVDNDLTLKSLQVAVGSPDRPAYLTALPMDGADLFYDEEACYKPDLLHNRDVPTNRGVYEIRGNMIIVGDKDGDAVGLDDSQLAYWSEVASTWRSRFASFPVMP